MARCATGPGAGRSGLAFGRSATGGPGVGRSGTGSGGPGSRACPDSVACGSSGACWVSGSSRGSSWQTPSNSATSSVVDGSSAGTGAGSGRPSSSIRCTDVLGGAGASRTTGSSRGRTSTSAAAGDGTPGTGPGITTSGTTGSGTGSTVDSTEDLPAGPATASTADSAVGSAGRTSTSGTASGDATARRTTGPEPVTVDTARGQRSETTPDGPAASTLCPSGASKDGFCQEARDDVNRDTGFTSGWSGTSRCIGGTDRHWSPGVHTGIGEDFDSRPRRHGHIVFHRPWLILVLIRAISDMYRSRSAAYVTIPPGGHRPHRPRSRARNSGRRSPPWCAPRC